MDRFQASQSDEGRYRLLVESISDYAIYMLDPTGIVSSWNPGAQRFKGYLPHEIIGEHFSRFYTDEDRAAGTPARALRTAETQGRFEAEGWRVRKDGTRFWASIVIDPVRAPDGKLIGFAKITRDLTERKAAEEELRQSQEQFTLLVQGVTDYAIYMISPQGIVNSWNKGAERIKGYACEEIIGEHFSRFYTEEDRATGEPQRALETAAREGRYEKEGWRVRKDGSRFRANVIIDAIHNDAGEMIGFAKITRDITVARENQMALDRARETLFQAQKMDAIGHLTGGVAHDFNNLLMAVLGSLELLRKRLPDDPQMKVLLDNAVHGAKRGATLTQRLLAFARRQEMRSEPVDLPDLVRGMAELLERSLGSSIEIETRFPLKLAPVLSDPNQLELAILNLAVNARDAMPTGGAIRILAREHTLDGETHGLRQGRYVCLSIVDTGAGMDPATLERATEPFFTTKGVGKGTGLGLPMVHGVAEQSGGALKIESAPGEGTSVSLWLPAATPDAAAPSPEPPAQAPLSSVPLRILAVDDDGLVLMNTTMMLEDLGHQVLEASSGSEALAILSRDEAIDLVVTDQNMPGMTGIQLVERIKSKWPRLKIVMATGYAELPDEQGAGLPRLSKPFTQQQLEAVVSRAAAGQTPG